MLVNHIWKEPKQGVDLGVICRYSPQISEGNTISGSCGKGNCRMYQKWYSCGVFKEEQSRGVKSEHI